MPLPEPEIISALTGWGWQGAAVRPMAGDASTKILYRVTRDGAPATAVLMLVPAGSGTYADFLLMTRRLRSVGLSAPEIFGADETLGAILMEDFGDELLDATARRAPSAAADLYEVATDVLFHLRDTSRDALSVFSVQEMVDASARAVQFYAPLPGADAEAFRAILHDALGLIAAAPPVVMLRDYHAQNLVWLPDRSGPARIGLLDYQDARIAHPAYDLVSLLRDARWDVPEDVRHAAYAHFETRCGLDPADLDLAYHILGAQRALGIMGVFAKIAVTTGRTGYLALLPRVWGHLQQAVSHPDLKDLGRFVAAHLPEPTSAILKAVTDRCQTP